MRTAIVLLAAVGLSVPALGQQRPDSSATPKRPTRLDELVTTATRTSQTISSSPQAVTALTRADLATSSSSTVPNLLWRIPGFATRDYQSSVFSNTSRSVVSFRGLNGSTAGRTLVLLDGVPLNDAFSGRLNWSRIPMFLVDRVEVVRGGGSMLWGSRALGGVINVLTTTPTRTGLTALAEGGAHATYRAAVAGTLRQSRLSASIAGDWSGTDGVVVIRKDQVGPVDLPNGGEDRVLFGKLGYEFTPSLKGWISGNYLSQVGKGTTTISDSWAHIGEVRGGVGLTTARRGVLELAGYVNDFDSHTLSSTISTDRTTATPNRVNNIPAHSAGASLQWSAAGLGRHQLVTGLDLSRTSGVLTEGANWSNGQMTLNRSMAGTQVLAGAFLQDNLSLGDRWRILAGVRFDAVNNHDGSRTDTNLTTQAPVFDTTYASQTRTRLNYSLGLRHSASDFLDWRASVYAAFRAPTLFELNWTNYSSRGSVTAANPGLLPERLFGAELGADLNVGKAVLARVTTFWNRVRDPIVDYTVGTTTTAGQVIEPCGAMPKNQVCRQRRNVHALRTLGVESEVEYHPGANWSLWASYTFNPTRISAPGQEIDGKVARGAARHIASAVATYDNPELLAITVEQRYVGSRSDDDLDTIHLDDFWVTGVRVSRRLWRESSLYLRIENLFDHTYPITQAANGLVEVGAPRWITVGLRASW